MVLKQSCDLRWPVLITRCTQCGDRRRDARGGEACECGYEHTTGVDVVSVEMVRRALADELYDAQYTYDWLTLEMTDAEAVAERVVKRLAA